MNRSLKLGVCTWTFGDLSLSEISRRVQTLGFDGVELAGDLALYQAREAGQILRDHGLETFSLTPENVDLVHPDVAVDSAGEPVAVQPKGVVHALHPVAQMEAQ